MSFPKTYANLTFVSSETSETASLPPLLPTGRTTMQPYPAILVTRMAGRSAASNAQQSRVQTLIFSDFGQQHTVSQTQSGRRIGTVAPKHNPRSLSKRSQAHKRVYPAEPEGITTQALYYMPALNTNTYTAKYYEHLGDTEVKSSITILRLHYTDTLHNDVYAKQRGHLYPEGAFKCFKVSQVIHN